MGLTITWLAIMVFCLIVEVSTVGLITIWFAGGALIAAIVSMIGGPMWLQIVLFLVASLVLLIFTRPIAVKYFNKNRTKTNVETIIGKQAIVTDRIDNLKGQGQIITDGMEWTARSANEEIIEEGCIVEIKEIKGVKAIVEQIKGEN